MARVCLMRAPALDALEQPTHQVYCRCITAMEAPTILVRLRKLVELHKLQPHQLVSERKNKLTDCPHRLLVTSCQQQQSFLAELDTGKQWTNQLAKTIM